MSCRSTTASRFGWLAFVTGGVVVDVWRTRVGDRTTFSQATRDTFHTDTRRGAVTFLVAWSALCVWFPVHILRRKEA